MNYPARTVFYFGIYLFGLGLILLFVPNLLLGIFGFPHTEEVWIRVVGMLVFLLGYYYTQSARAGFAPYLQWTVYARLGVLGFFLAFVLLKLAPAALILFGAVDALGAAWTWMALRRETAA